jgi:hypothetical protein
MELTLECETFYRERDRRTISYGASEDVLGVPVTIGIGTAAAETRAGQIALLALIGMAARSHRRLRIVVPPAALQLAPLFGGTDLSDAVRRAIAAIDPCNQTEYLSMLTGLDALSVAVGELDGAAIYLGCEGMLAELGHSPRRVVDAGGAVFGAGLAACMGAAALLHIAAGHPVGERRLSLWNFADGDAAEVGDAVDRRISVGSVLMLGAGAVGSCACYWLREVGIDGNWTVVDGDRFQLHNINRSLGATAANAGWPGGQPADKAPIAAGLIGAEAFVGWYDEWLDMHDDEPAPDLVIPLANDRLVRPAVAARADELVVHATTGTGWTAELHRHLLDQDDCIACRIPEEQSDQSPFLCASGELTSSGADSTDAALPFLSAGAALLLVRFLDAMADVDSELLTGPRNHWGIAFGPPGIENARLKSRRWARADTCPHRPAF